MTDELTRTQTAPGDATARPATRPTGARYVDRGLLGRGGMGEVRRVFDRRLKRELAMKRLDPRLLDSPGARARFVNEAEITAGLQHPGVVAVHDSGEDVAGRPWYTMKIVEGRTFSAVIAEVHAGGEWTFRRLMDAFGRICDAVAYAHQHGVVHRDLKPSNLMVGAFGEVLVMDWGLAFRGSAPVAIGEAEAPADARLTRAGAVLGTLAYMPPEQARGALDRVGPPADVYALGAVLFEILAGRPPFRDSHSALERLCAGEIPEVVAPAGQTLPAELVEVCRQAMRPAPVDRLTAAEIVRRVRDWSDGARRRVEALALVAAAEEKAARIATLRGEAQALTARANAVLDPLPPHAPENQKIPGWRLEDQAAEAARAARLAEVAYVQDLRTALNVLPDLPEARALLADHHRARLIAAEARRDPGAAAEETALLRAYDAGRYTAWLTGDGAVSLITDPPGAQVTAYRYVEVNRRLQPQRIGVIGQTPLCKVPLPMGSYLLIVEAPGRVPMRYPVFIERRRHWEGGEAPIPILRPEQVRPDEVYVPAGWFWFGGDPEAADSAPRQRVWVDGFLMGRFAITNAQYRRFLEGLIAGGEIERARALCPPFELGADGEEIPWRIESAAVHAGPAALDDWPVTEIDWYRASAYASHRGAALPSSVEWEKAARGVDGRFFPWGDRMDQTWACVANSHGGSPTRASIHAYPNDVSPYGLHGMAGNVRDWCRNNYERDGLIRAHPLPTTASDSEGFFNVKGGTWSATMAGGRLARRFAARPTDRFSSLGFRLVRQPRSRQVGTVSSASR